MSRVVYFFALLVQFRVFSVGLLTQFYLANMYLGTSSELLGHKSEFLLGVWFPGIWYIADQGPPFAISVNSIGIKHVMAEKNPFRKGVAFHYYLQQQEKLFFENTGILEKIGADLPYSIQECYVNILEDLEFCNKPFVNEAKRLLNETLFEEFDVSTFSTSYNRADIITWYHTIFLSINTHPLEIPDNVSFANTYKGLKISLELSDKLIEDAKQNLPKLARDPEVTALIETYIKKMCNSKIASF